MATITRIPNNMKTIIISLLILLALSAAGQEKDTIIRDTATIFVTWSRGNMTVHSTGRLLKNVGNVNKRRLLYGTHHSKLKPIINCGQIGIIEVGQSNIVISSETHRIWMIPITGCVFFITWPSLNFDDVFKPNQKTNFNIFL